MSDLINGREMLKRYQVDLCYGIACKECSMCTEDGGCRVEEWIDKFPSADRPQDGEFENFDREALILLIEAQKERIGDLLADRPSGEWIDDIEAESNGDYWANCSRCGMQIDVHQNRGYYNYCPNCGARMKGADNEID